MFMKIIFKTTICVMLLFCKFVNAQVPCEFDTSNGAYGLTLNSAGYKIVQSIDKNSNQNLGVDCVQVSSTRTGDDWQDAQIIRNNF